MSKVIYYTGIGSRDTSEEMGSHITDIATYLSDLGLVLRSGGADGADTFFEKGSNNSEIYIPWKGFNGREGDQYIISPKDDEEAEEIASNVHPAWNRCTRWVRKLHARNVYQVLGQDFDTPSSFVLFYAKEINGIVKGGTATAVHLARSLDIPTVNMRMNPLWGEELMDILRTLNIVK